MKELFLESSRLVNRNLILVILVGFFHVSYLSGAIGYFYLIGIVIAFIASVVINGRITNSLTNNETKIATDIIKINWLNYLIVLIVLGIPAILYGQINKLLNIQPEIYLLTSEALKAFIWIISIYVVPIVFIKKESFVAVIYGITYFFNNLKQTGKIIPYIIIVFFLNIASIVWAITKIQNNVEIIYIFPVLIFINIVATYLSFIVFASAATILTNNREKNA